jgi:hypothetical protein
MVERLKTASKVLFETGGVLEYFTVFPEDSFLVTYSRSTDGWGHAILPDAPASEQPKE